MLRSAVVAVSLCALSACTSPDPPGTDTRVDADADADADTDTVGATGTAATGETGAAGSGCVIEAGDGGCREVSAADVVPIVAADGVHMPGFGYDDGAGGFVAAVSDYGAGQILIARSTDLRTFATPVPIDPPLASDCTGAFVDGQPYLYYVRWVGGLTRAAFTAAGDGVGAAEALTLTGAPAVPYWPQAVGGDDGVLLGFVQSQTSASLATSADGLAFDVVPAPVGTDNMRGVLVHVGRTAGGRRVFTHQDADPTWHFTSKVQWSADGVAWSGPIVVDDSADNVHDPFPVARRDAGVDLYYLKAGDAQDLNVFRRSMSEDGVLGPVQAVTAADVGHVEKPQARRLADGRIGLMFAVRQTYDRYDVAFAVLDDDAPTD